MSKVTMIGTMTCQDGKNEAIEAMFAGMVEASKEEPGCEIYSYLRGEGNDYHFFALMAGPDAMQAHGQSDAMQQAMTPMGDVLAGPPQMMVTHPVAANGFNL
ncbi:MAG: quinol monooxygenase YgiN [Candidatus Aldehydirespiratoraceae bacterium]|jgi:quinol monooxygenase YgiN